MGRRKWTATGVEWVVASPFPGPRAEAAPALLMPCTATGVELDWRHERDAPPPFGVGPSPSWPLPLSPQQSIAPPESKAQAWVLPTLTAFAPVMPFTATGVGLPLPVVP